MARMTVNTLKEKKTRGEKITMVTAYDYPSARIVEEAGLDIILVGDSLGTTVLGYDTTLPVTMDDMVHHTRVVTKGAPQTFVVADLPFLSYHLSVEKGLANGGRFLQEAGAQAVKLEGGQERKDVVKALVEAGIPVMAHLGLTPQSVNQLGGYKVQAQEAEPARKLVEDAKILEEAGIFALVLECVPAPLATLISRHLSIPTIGIGAGAGCDGQVLVWHDLLGYTKGTKPRFVKQYVNLYDEILHALQTYQDEVRSGKFPGEEHSFPIKVENIPKIN